MFKKNRTVEYIIYGVALVIVAVFAPYVPTATMRVPDPVSRTDARVRAELSDEALQEVMRVVRRGRYNSVFEIVRFETRSPLLLIEDARKSDPSAGSGLEVMVGTICGPLCGSGRMYRLEKTDGRWRIVATSEWVS
jgi:hypothetical protein